MPKNKWTKTATSASLAILGVTQLNNKADANIVLQGSNLTSTAPNYSSWSLDHKQGYSAVAFVTAFSTGAASVSATTTVARFRVMNLGSVVSSNALVVNQKINLTNGVSSFGYFGFRDTNGGIPIYGWARWTKTTSDSVTLNEWYYNDTPGGSIVVGQTKDIPFDFNPLQGAALGVPIFMGLRQLKRRKAKLNTMVSVKGKEKIHPLALLGMGAAGVRKWREQKDKDAA